MKVAQRTLQQKVGLQASRIVFWNSEDIFEPPARKTKSVMYAGLKSATLYVEINLRPLCSLNSIVFNQNPIGADAHTSYDVTGLLRQGANEVVLDYYPLFYIPGTSAGVVTIYLDIVADVVTPETTELLMWILVIGMVAVAGVAMFFLIRRRPG